MYSVRLPSRRLTDLRQLKFKLWNLGRVLRSLSTNALQRRLLDTMCIQYFTSVKMGIFFIDPTKSPPIPKCSLGSGQSE